METPVTPRMAVYKHLLETPEVAALVGDRIYHQVRDDGAAYPCIVIATIDDVDQRDLSGVAWTETRLQITAMATTLATAEQVVSAVKKALEGFTGMMAGVLPVIRCLIDEAVPIYQEDTGQTHYHVDVLIRHKGGAYVG